MKTTISLAQLEQLTASWKTQFDNPPSLSFSWGMDAQGVLTLNGSAVCRLADLAHADRFDPEWLALDLQDGSYIVLEIDWPFEGPARISEIVTHKVMAA